MMIMHISINRYVSAQARLSHDGSPLLTQISSSALSQAEITLKQ